MLQTQEKRLQLLLLPACMASYSMLLLLHHHSHTRARSVPGCSQPGRGGTLGYAQQRVLAAFIIVVVVVCVFCIFLYDKIDRKIVLLMFKVCFFFFFSRNVAHTRTSAPLTIGSCQGFSCEGLSAHRLFCRLSFLLYQCVRFSFSASAFSSVISSFLFPLRVCVCYLYNYS